MEELWKRAAIMGRQRRGSEGLRTVNILWCLLFFLPSLLSGADSLPVVGQMGGSITLKCNYTNTQDPILTFGTRIAYGVNQDEHFRDRVHKTGTCDLILQDLKTTDAGKYLLKGFVEGEPLFPYSYELCVDVKLTAQEGEEVMFDDLPGDAESVEHLTNTGSIDVWRRREGVLTDRLMDKDGLLSIRSFRRRDAGTYRVLNSTGGVLVTVTLTESGSESKDNQHRTHDDIPDDTERVHAGIGVVFLVALMWFFWL